MGLEFNPLMIDGHGIAREEHLVRDWDFNGLIMQSFIGKNLYMLDRPIHMGTMPGIFSAGCIDFELQPLPERLDIRGFPPFCSLSS